MGTCDLTFKLHFSIIFFYLRLFNIYFGVFIYEDDEWPHGRVELPCGLTYLYGLLFLFRDNFSLMLIHN